LRKLRRQRLAPKLAQSGELRLQGTRFWNSSLPVDASDGSITTEELDGSIKRRGMCTMNTRILGVLMFLAGVALLIYGLVMRFFINPKLVRMAAPADDFFLRPPVARTGIPDYIPIIAGAILIALGVLLRFGK
jgi:hypothetical protein